MSALHRRARAELDLAIELARFCAAKERRVRNGYQRVLKKQLRDLGVTLQQLERESWSEIEDVPPPRVCAVCRKELGPKVRRDAETCSQLCRQRRHRALVAEARAMTGPGPCPAALRPCMVLEGASICRWCDGSPSDACPQSSACCIPAAIGRCRWCGSDGSTATASSASRRAPTSSAASEVLG